MAEATPDLASEWAAVAAERDQPTTSEPAVVIEEAAPATPAAVTPVAEPAAAAPEVVVDPYAGLSPDVKAKLERFDAMSDTLKNTAIALKETQGRVSSLQSEFAKTRQAQPAGDTPNAKQIAAAKDPEKWATLKKDFPEWAEGIEAFVDARAAAAMQGSGMTPEQVEQLVATRTSEVTAKTEDRIERAMVEGKYPSWDTDVKTPAFESWFKVQKPDVQALAQSPKGRDALRMLDLFHESLKTPVVRQARAAKLEAAVTARPGTQPAVTKSYDDLTPKEKWEYEAAQRERRDAANR
jgi:hypothetical protein